MNIPGLQVEHVYLDEHSIQSDPSESLHKTHVLLKVSKKEAGGHFEHKTGPSQARQFSPNIFEQLMQFALSLYSPSLHCRIPNP